MLNIVNIFNNREKSIVIWLIILVIWVLSNKVARQGLRKTLPSLLKVLFWGKIGTTLFLMLLYITFIILLIFKIGFWNIALLKDTVYWLLGTAFVIFINVNKFNSESHYFKKVILDNLKFAVILEFLVNLYVFNIFIELLLVPFILIVSILLAFSNTKKEYVSVKKLLTIVLSIFGVIFILYAINQIATDFKDFATLQNLREFFLTPILTLAYMPFIYVLVLYMNYESLFVRIGFWVKKDKKLSNHVKWQIFKRCFLSLRKLNKFSLHINKNLMNIQNNSDVTHIISTFSA